VLESQKHLTQGRKVALVRTRTEGFFEAPLCALSSSRGTVHFSRPCKGRSAVSRNRKIRKRKLETGLEGEKRSGTNPTHLRDLISTEYEEKARNKPTVDIHNYINILRGFLASFCRNMNEKRVYVPFRIRVILHAVNGLRESRPRFSKNMDRDAPYVRSRIRQGLLPRRNPRR